MSGQDATTKMKAFADFLAEAIEIEKDENTGNVAVAFYEKKVNFKARFIDSVTKHNFYLRAKKTVVPKGSVIIFGCFKKPFLTLTLEGLVDMVSNQVDATI